MNLVIISGRLCADPELRQTNSNKPVCLFTVAVEDGKDKDGNKKAQFVPCVAWDKTAETISKYFLKGNPITLTGHLSCRTWERDGKKNYAWEVFVDRFEFVPGVNTKKPADPQIIDMDDDDAELPF